MVQLLTPDNLRIMFVWFFVFMAADTVYLCCRYLPKRRPAPMYLHIHRQGAPAGEYIAAPMMKPRVTVASDGMPDIRFRADVPIRFYLDHIGEKYYLKVQDGEVSSHLSDGTLCEGDSFLISGYQFSVMKGV